MAWALIAGLLYGPAALLLEKRSGVLYTEFAASTANMISGVVVPLWIMVAVLALLVTFLGWWRPILRDEYPVPRWLLIFPLLMAVFIILGINYPRLAILDPQFLLWLTIGVIAVGFCEEIVYRGIAVVGFREALPEWQVWFFSTLLFSVLHLWNAFLGQSPGAVAAQFCLTFIMGTTLYICRRATGTILVPMILHAAWDWATLSGGATATAVTGDLPVSPVQLAMLAIYPVVIVLFCFAYRPLFERWTRPAPA